MLKLHVLERLSSKLDFRSGTVVVPWNETASSASQLRESRINRRPPGVLVLLQTAGGDSERKLNWPHFVEWPAVLPVIERQVLVMCFIALSRRPLSKHYHQIVSGLETEADVGQTCTFSPTNELSVWRKVFWAVTCSHFSLFVVSCVSFLVLLFNLTLICSFVCFLHF